MALLKLKERVIEAFAATRDIKKFPELTGELSEHYSKNWAVGSYKEAMESLERGSLDELEVIFVCIDKDDEDNLSVVTSFIKAVKARRLKVILIVSDISPTSLHQVMRQGADDFIPCPAPKDAFGDALARLRADAIEDETEKKKTKKRRRGIVLPIYGVAGGVGTSTFAVNLAWEMAIFDKKSNVKVCILDLNFQAGSVSTYLDLGFREAVSEMLTHMDNLDADMFAESLTSFKSRMAVLTAPPEIFPLDIISGNDIENLLSYARESYDFVIVDMPTTLVDWSANVLQMAETYFAVMELDMRSAQNMMRFLRVLKSEELPEDKLQFVLNFAPAFTDLNGKARAKRFSESLGIDINILLPDGGKQVLAANDQGRPLADATPKNPLRKEIRKIAASLITMAEEQKAAIA